jgi:ribosome maturation factor RimP
LTLEGVILEPEHDFAFVRTPEGSLRAVQVGEQVENGTVKLIERTRIVVELAGEEVEVPLQKAEQK